MAAACAARRVPGRTGRDRVCDIESKRRRVADSRKTATPIKYVIVLIGENRTFDHVFATYVPKGRDSVANLLSKGIINADGTPGPNFNRAAQFQAIPPFKTKYFISLDRNEKAPYQTLPAPTLNFAPTKPIFRWARRPRSWQPSSRPCVPPTSIC